MSFPSREVAVTTSALLAALALTACGSEGTSSTRGTGGETGHTGGSGGTGGASTGGAGTGGVMTGGTHPGRGFPEGSPWVSFYGGADGDYLFGQDGLDNLYGEAGRDWLDPGHDSYVDVVDGGADSDADTFVRHYRRFFMSNGQYIDVSDVADTYLNFTIGLDTVFTRRED